MFLSKFLIIITSIYLFFYYFVQNQDYINVSQVIKKQILSILKKRKSDRRKSDILAFINIYIIPLFLSFLISLNHLLNQNFYDNTLLILAILVSVFLTLISILTSKSYKTKNQDQKIIINLTFNNVYFLSVLSILLLILCFLKTSISHINLLFLKDIYIISKIITINNCKIIFNTIVIYLILEIIIHLLIVLKRIEQIFFITYED